MIIIWLAPKQTQPDKTPKQQHIIVSQNNYVSMFKTVHLTIGSPCHISEVHFQYSTKTKLLDGNISSNGHVYRKLAKKVRRAIICRKIP